MSNPLRFIGILLLLSMGPVLEAHDAPGDIPRIHFICGAKEYRAEQSVTAWARRLEEGDKAVCAVSIAKDKQKSPVPGLENIADADILVLYCRRITLPEEQLRLVKAYIASKRPIIGIRTASHGFQNLLSLDRDVMGGSYKGHGAGEAHIGVQISNGAENHPILVGIEPWTRPGKLYRNPALGQDTALLLTGRGTKETQPLAWAREHDGRRTFYTSMGLPADFQHASFQRLLANAVKWCLAPAKQE